MKQQKITTSLKAASSAEKIKNAKKIFSIEPNEEQKAIIFENKEQHMQIKACAGSGKTTTILCRVKHLIEIEKVHPERILITAFNVDAAKSVKTKLAAMMSERIEKLVHVNNIDKLSRQWVIQARQFEVDQLQVKEFTTKVVKLMKNDSAFRASIARQFDYIFFDEFQDINDDEYELLRIFAGEGTIITFVGDDAQNIYGFREGTRLASSETLQTDFKGIKNYFLTTNYRSTEPIIQFANEVIAGAKTEYGYKMKMISHPPNNTGKCLLPDCSKFLSIAEQNQAIIEHILEIVEGGIQFNQIAVLSRTNKPLQFLEEALELHNNKADKDSKNISKQQTNQKNEDGELLPRMNNSVSIPFVAHISNNKEKQSKISFKATQSDQNTPAVSRLTLTTIHKAKGLEWDVVFLIGLNDDFFPGTNKDKEEEEERRVFYVGITRAKKRLYMSFIWSKKNQNMTRFIAEVSSKLYTGYSQPMIKEQTKCNEQMRQIEKIRSKTVLLTEIIEFLTRDHYEELRNLGALDFKKESTQIHFKCSLGQYIIENNLVPEFAIFFKQYIIRSIGEQCSNMLPQTPEGKQDQMGKAFDNKYCQSVLFSSTSMAATERNELQKANFSMDVGLLSTQYIEDKSKSEEILKSLIAFQDQNQKSEDILKHIFNVSMCQSIFNQRRRLLHKEDAFKYFEFNKNILKNGKKAFVSELFRPTSSNSSKEIYVNETLYCESFQMKADFDIIKDNIIYEIRFQQNSVLKPEDAIELLAKAAILENVWKIKAHSISIYYPLQGELTSIDLLSKDPKLQEILKILYQVRQDKQEACSAGSKSATSSLNSSQLYLQQQSSSQSSHQIPIINAKNVPKLQSTSVEQVNSQATITSAVFKPVRTKKPMSLYEKYGEEPYDVDLYEVLESSHGYEDKYLDENAKLSNEKKQQRRSSESEEGSSQSNNNFGFIKASDIAQAKVVIQGKKSIVSQQKCMNSLSINNKDSSSNNNSIAGTISSTSNTKIIDSKKKITNQSCNSQLKAPQTITQAQKIAASTSKMSVSAPKIGGSTSKLGIIPISQADKEQNEHKGFSFGKQFYKYSSNAGSFNSKQNKFDDF